MSLKRNVMSLCMQFKSVHCDDMVLNYVVKEKMERLSGDLKPMCLSDQFFPHLLSAQIHLKVSACFRIRD